VSGPPNQPARRPTTFTITDLRLGGFRGFVPVANLGRDALATIPRQAGVYAVVRETTAAPQFLAVSSGGWFKGNDPTVPVATLVAKWVPGAQTLYLGKANLTARRSLRKRVTELVDFSHGRPVAHRGGEWLWQLEGCQALRVAWLVEPYCAGLEYLLLGAFVSKYGRLPFANRSAGERNSPRPPWWDDAGE
jgi:hypothetical protein